ncbi:GntR family transcriptional regulator [Desemzia sp. FAM 23991]|uniref:GntR family transcriptional regulator n=1 Tax=unclassified Desemzia TaxID=2685243 RepID=UPI003885CF1D
MHKYEQVAQAIRDRIQNGTYTLKSALPDQMQLCKEFGASRITIKRALNLLIEEGYLYSRQGSGTYVMKNALAKNELDSRFDVYTGLTDQLSDQIVTSKVIQFVIRNPAEDEADKLLLTEEDFIYDIQRVRYVDGEEYLIEHTLMPVEVIPDVTKKVLAGSIYSYIQHTLGLKIGGLNRRITAERPDELDQEYLFCTKEDPVLQVEQVVHLIDGTPFEYSRTRHRFDKGGVNVVKNYGEHS